MSLKANKDDNLDCQYEYQYLLRTGFNNYNLSITANCNDTERVIYNLGGLYKYTVSKDTGKDTINVNVPIDSQLYNEININNIPIILNPIGFQSEKNFWDDSLIYNI